MTCKNDRRPTPTSLFNLATNHLDAVTVQGIGRLVEHDDVGRLHKGRRNTETLLHTERILAVVPLVGRIKPDSLDPTANLICAKLALNRCEHAQVFEARVAAEKRRAFEQQPQTWRKGDILTDCFTVHVDGSRRRPDQPCDHPHEHGLSRPVGPGEARYLAGPKRHTHIADSLSASKCFTYAVHMYHESASFPSTSCLANAAPPTNTAAAPTSTDKPIPIAESTPA